MNQWFVPYCPAAVFVAALLVILVGRLAALSGRARGWHRRSRPRRPAEDRYRIRTRRKPEWVRHALIEIAGCCPAGTGCRTVALLFNRRFAASRNMTVGKSFVACVIREHRYAIADLRRRLKHRIPRDMAANRVWAIDMTGKGDNSGRVHAILGIVDHGTRRLLCLKVLARRTSWTLLGQLCLAIAEYGKPVALRTDNEASMTSELFRAALALMGIHHQRTSPGCPWQNGRIERLFGTFKQKLDCVCVADAKELRSLLVPFRYWYNGIRPHQHLGGRTPDEVWDGVDPYSKPPRRVNWSSAWDGMLTGFEFRR